MLSGTLCFKLKFNAFQAVDNNANVSNLSYVYTAYFDDRQTPDVEPSWLPVVRVFAWFNRTENVTGQWRCVLWDDELRRPMERAVVNWTDLNIFDSTIE